MLKKIQRKTLMTDKTENKFLESGDVLDALFGGNADSGGNDIGGLDNGEGDQSESVKSLISKAQNAYEKAIECQKNGDWEGYGKYIKQLENYLTKLANESGSGSAEAPAAEPAAEEPAAEDDAA